MLNFDAAHKSLQLPTKILQVRVFTAASTHGAGRLDLGFSLDAAMAEYRALRASVIRLWQMSNKTMSATAMEDIIRFNEAIDQAISESLTSYSNSKEKQTLLFNAILSSLPQPSSQALLLTWMAGLAMLIDPSLNY